MVTKLEAHSTIAMVTMDREQLRSRFSGNISRLGEWFGAMKFFIACFASDLW
jgi:hypothetical protein